MGVKFIIIIIIIFFYSILGCCHIGHHPQGDLAIFDFRPVMKIKINKNPFYIFSDLFKQMCRKH
jgi:hypothetical protein